MLSRFFIRIYINIGILVHINIIINIVAVIFYDDALFDSGDLFFLFVVEITGVDFALLEFAAEVFVHFTDLLGVVV